MATFQDCWPGFRLLAVLLIAGSLGSCSTDSTDPNRFSLPPSDLAHLRAPQSLGMRNAYPAPAPIKTGLLAFDQQQLTETAIAMLTRAMDKHGIAVAAQAEKTVTLRVRLTNLRMRGMPPQRTARIYLDAELGDGTSTSLEAEETSLGEFDRAIDGAILVALKDLVADEKFVAYMKR